MGHTWIYGIWLDQEEVKRVRGLGVGAGVGCIQLRSRYDHLLGDVPAFETAFRVSSRFSCLSRF